MKATPQFSLAQSHQILLSRLESQREQIIHQLAPAVPAEHGPYPRSITIRLLREHSDLVKRVVWPKIATMTGPRIVGWMALALSLAKIVHAASLARQQAPATRNHPTIGEPYEQKSSER